MIPVFRPLITKKNRKSVLSTLKRGEISGNFGLAIKEFESKVRIEISAIQRILRDIEKFKSYDSVVPKAKKKDLKNYESLRSEMKKYLYELIMTLEKRKKN